MGKPLKFQAVTKDFNFKNTTEKALSPRGILTEEAIAGIVSIENFFVQKMMEIYEEGIDTIISRAKKGKATRQDLEADIGEFNQKFIADSTKEAELFARDAYEAGLTEELGLLGVERAERFSQADLNAIELLKERPEGLLENLKTFNEQQSVLIRDVIERGYSAPEGLDLDKMVKEMEHLTSGAPGGERYKLERIARSETTKISNTARSVQWQEYADPSKEEYHWSVAQVGKHGASRLCPICEAIANGGTPRNEKGKTVKYQGQVWDFEGNPYTLKELERITNGFVPHPNCRCTAVRIPEGVL